MTERRIEMKQVLLGLQPYILLKPTVSGDNDELEIGLDYGGGVETEFIGVLLQSAIDALPEGMREGLDEMLASPLEDSE